MNDESLILIPYTHESCLPCELPEVVAHIRKRSITASRDNKVGLDRDIHAIPLNRGYLLHTKDLVLTTNSLRPFLNVDGTQTIDELSNAPEMESVLEQLHYYNLLSFGSSNGQLRLKNVAKKYEVTHKELYRGNFVTFPLVPITVELDITNACNFACIHCSRNSKPKEKANSNDELSTKELLSIVDQCAQIGVVELILMGGEPMTHPDFFKLVRYAKEKGIRDVRTSTNAWNIDERVARALSEYFDNIQISIHGASSSTHDSVVNKKGAWRQAKRAIKILKKYNLKVNVSFTVMRENVDDISKMPYLAKEWGADSLRFIRLNRQGRGSSLKGWSEEEVEQISKEIKGVHENLSLDVELDAGGFSPLHPLKNDACFYGCSAGKTLLSITYNGRVKACGSLDNHVGEIREKSILDIWHSPELVRMRKQSSCECSYRTICYGSCMIPS